ncbi:hypothetical protein LXD69_08155 [Flavobacterium sediminilitoris]|uniref:Lipoprotein n=1 Tax=Flavobacterium sediminilitoris TaxID=2024526 RepID=A0ABY4HTK5_9FLAO|nr:MULTISPECIES: hypothetical protein [Flavobacterium]UOX35482.1 hypothetical protein LXD69_08155 [Flavobacterium sediminilitoris]
MNKLIIIISFFIMSCNHQETFIDLKNHSRKGTFSRGEDKGKFFYYQSVLVSGISEDLESFKNELLTYHSKKIDSVFQDNKTIQFSSIFYKKNSKTSYFIDNSDDPGGFSSEILSDYYEEYGIAEIITKKIDNSDSYKTEIKLSKM